MTSTQPEPRRGSPDVEFRRTAGLLCLMLVLTVGYRLLIVRSVVPSIFWDTTSYVNFARYLAKFHRLPALDVRTPGYPVFLGLVGGSGVNLWRAMRAQQALGAMSNILVTWIAWTLTKRRSAALIAGIASLALPDLLFYENTIYTETLARFLVLAAFAGLACGLCSGRPRPIALVCGCVAAGLAPLVRPILAILVPTTIAVLFVWARSGEPARKRWVRLGACISIAPMAALVLWNVRSAHYFGLARAAEMTVADYVGFPAVYEHLPDSLQGVRWIYEAEALRRNEPIVAFWNVVPQLKEYEKAQGRVYRTDAALLASVARRCLLARPGRYLAVWFGATLRFLTDFNSNMGFYRDVNASIAGKTQIFGWRRAWIVSLTDFWRRAIRVVSALALAGPLFIFFKMKDSSASADEGCSSGVLWGYLTAIGVTLTNTALEPFPGQARYRVPIEEVFLILSVLAVFRLVERAQSRIAGESDSVHADR